MSMLLSQARLAQMSTGRGETHDSDVKPQKTNAPKIRQTKLLIDGKWLDSNSNDTFETLIRLMRP